ncbi:MAG TPA: hypothetical protein VFK90_16370 [Anaeromyxobacter sp.]|nr:hypothetical protein [Anaeromyxobacter sp.]
MVAPADAETSVADLQKIARLWSSWQAFSRVEFPFRRGDPVDVVVELKLRQQVDGHRASNMLRAVVAGLSLGLLTPVMGVRISEVHDVALRCHRAGAAATMPVEFQVSTDLEMGVMADGVAAAKSLDDEHLKRVASQALRAFVSACGVGDPSLHEPRPGDAPQR